MILSANLKKILIIDFGSQFTQLIARRIRELEVYSEIISHKKINITKIINNKIYGIILSGGPLNVYENNDINDTNLFDMIWNLYKSTILNLSTITHCNVILTDIYYITDSNYARYIPIIEKWNANLYQFANNHNLKVFKISKLLTKPEDFTNGIEPSIIGGTKMVNSFIY